MILLAWRDSKAEASAAPRSHNESAALRRPVLRAACRKSPGAAGHPTNEGAASRWHAPGCTPCAKAARGARHDVVGVSAMVEIGYSMSSEEHSPLDLVRYAKIAEDVGFALRAHLRPLPSLDRPPGAESVRVERHRCDRHRDRSLEARHRRHVPAHAHAPGDRRPGRGDRRRDDAGTLLPGRRQRGEPERAHPGRGLAGRGHPPRDARGGDRGAAPAVEGRRAESLRALLHGGERARVHASRGAAPGDGGGGREGHGRAGRQRGGRTDRYGAAGRSRRDVRTCRREPEAALRPADRVLGALRRGGAPRGTTNGGPTPRCRAISPRSCPGPGTSSRPASWSTRTP